MDKIKVLVIPKDKEAKNALRVTKPHLYLQDKHDNFFIDINYDITTTDEATLKEYDIVVYHEYIDGDLPAGSFANKLKELGVKGVLDIDDNWGLYKNSQFYQFVKHQEASIKEAIRSADTITTSNEVMFNKLKSLNPNADVQIIRDAVDNTEKQYNKITEPSERLRLGIVVGDYNLSDLKKLEGLVSKLKSDKVLDKVQFVLCGFHLESYTTKENEVTGEKDKVKRKPEETVFYQYEKILTQAYTSVSPEYKKHLTDFTNSEYSGVSNEPYRRVWAKPNNKKGEYYAEFDVTLAPMDVNPFNETLTPYHLIESGLYKKPIIAQNFGEYGRILENAYVRGGTLDLGGTGLLVDTKKNHKEWFKYIKKLASTDKKDLEVLGENLHKIVEYNNVLEYTIEDRKNLYEKLVKTSK